MLLARLLEFQYETLHICFPIQHMLTCTAYPDIDENSLTPSHHYLISYQDICLVWIIHYQSNLYSLPPLFYPTVITVIPPPGNPIPFLHHPSTKPIRQFPVYQPPYNRFPSIPIPNQYDQT